MKTVIQKIGPLYGEAINGSVFGQPNGSEAIPKQNKIYVLTDYPNNHYLRNYGDNTVRTCSSSGTVGNCSVMASEIQFSGTYSIKIEVGNDANFTNVLSYSVFNGFVGSSNISVQVAGVSSQLTVVAGTTYYLRASVIYQGQVICTSETIELEGYA